MKLWMTRFKGTRPLDEIEFAVGRTGGLVLRVHEEGGETRVYFAADEEPRRLQELLGEAALPGEASEAEVVALR